MKIQSEWLGHLHARVAMSRFSDLDVRDHGSVHLSIGVKFTPPIIVVAWLKEIMLWQQ